MTSEKPKKKSSKKKPSEKQARKRLKELMEARAERFKKHKEGGHGMRRMQEAEAEAGPEAE